MDEEKGELEFKMTNLNPKENAKTYIIKTVQDIADCVNEDNYKGFLVDFETFLLSIQFFKSVDPNGQISEFSWTDDWKEQPTN